MSNSHLQLHPSPHLQLHPSPLYPDTGRTDMLSLDMSRFRDEELPSGLCWLVFHIYGMWLATHEAGAFACGRERRESQNFARPNAIIWKWFETGRHRKEKWLIRPFSFLSVPLLHSRIQYGARTNEIPKSISPTNLNMLNLSWIKAKKLLNWV